MHFKNRMVVKMKIALTGHREERLKNLGTESEIYGWLRKEVLKNNCTDAYCGMASGADIMFGKLIIQLKQLGYDIKLHCVLPCKDYNKSHPDYEFLRENSDTFEYLSKNFYKGCDNARDEKMVADCDILIALWDGIKAGGVWSTIRKAEKYNKEIILYKRI